MGKIVSISSTKGGVGKSTMALNLAGIYSLLKKKVLIIDLDLYSGGIATSLNISNEKDIFIMVDGLHNNRYTEFADYVVKYNDYIDVISCPKDPRLANQLESKYLPIIFEKAKYNYDVVLVDTNHVLDEINLTILDNSYNTLFVLSNDIVDLKNMKSLMSIFKDADKSNYYIVLNNSINNKKEYLTLFDIKNVIGNSIDFEISKSFFIKSIEKYMLNGEILTLSRKIHNSHYKDIKVLKNIALKLIADNKGEEDNG
ncbi:MAG: AAA family ATPase [bacterium]|nr:AAA family ATPase [bacterium]